MGTEPTTESSRIDSSSHELLTRLSRLGADSFGYKAELSVDKELAQLLRLRVAQINNCTYCLPALRSGTRLGHITDKARHAHRLVGDTTLLACRTSSSCLYRGVDPCQ